MLLGAAERVADSVIAARYAVTTVTVLSWRAGFATHGLAGWRKRPVELARTNDDRAHGKPLVILKAQPE